MHFSFSYFFYRLKLLELEYYFIIIINIVMLVFTAENYKVFLFSLFLTGIKLKAM
jgi:hypothetical protein